MSLCSLRDEYKYLYYTLHHNTSDISKIVLISLIKTVILFER